jgi:hypothetical protein
MPTSNQIRDVDWNVVGDEVITYMRNLLPILALPSEDS